MKRRPEQYRDQPFIDYWVGVGVSFVLAWLAIRALRRGDIHEVNHLYAGLNAGDSNHERRPCMMPSHLMKRDDVVLLTFDNGGAS